MRLATHSMLPSPDDRIYAPYKIGALVEVLAEQGIPAEDSLRGSGVAANELGDPYALTSVRQYMTVCMNAVSLGCNAATPFEVGSRLHVSAYGMYGYALLSCLTLREYFKLAVQYRRLATPPLSIEWAENPDTVIWTFPDIFVANPSQDLRQFLIEQQFSLHVTHLEDVAGRSCPPLEARFTYRAPEHADIYSRYLKCPCLFDQPKFELVYDAALLDQRPQMAHRLTAALVQETCDRLIGSAKTSAGTSGYVYRTLMDHPGDFLTMDAVAETLNMTTRTLRRHLEAEGTTYRHIMDDVRSSLAIEYLNTTRMSTIDIAMLLGFSDAASFRKALKRWTGKGPGQLRRSFG
ncbi:AraC family transcriptional regulator [Paracoccus versutus]|uniref:AraC family transcriptional regulator n=1 Tax=Paracoccus versutus TaxID=34007 RepID=UPI000DF8375A|nr:AraC family transcriptional regulator [Paracoccus versutus]RDD72581.1 AraC family transcriptional regulator [Paracoccus versutus]